jgi:hypothetical protein
MDEANAAPASAVVVEPEQVARALSVREITTLRAALRLWLETPAAAIPVVCYAEQGPGALILADRDIERLAATLALAGSVTVRPVNAEAHFAAGGGLPDPRRI